MPIFAVLVLWALAADGSMEVHRVHYDVTFDAAAAEARVTMEVHGSGHGDLAIGMPAWAPGSYRIVDHGEDAFDEFALLDSEGRAIPWSREGTNRVATEAAGGPLVRLSYAIDLPDGRPWETGAFHVPGPKLYTYVASAKDVPHSVTFRLPKGWSLACGLGPTTPEAAFRAPDYDVLADNPLLLGRFDTYRFQSHGAEIVWCLDRGLDPDDKADRGAFGDMLQTIVDYQSELMGGLPFERFVFQFVRSGGFWGLEHLTSTTIGMNGRIWQEDWTTADSLHAHEFFHLWNVKRIRPEPLGPFDYSQPVRTNDLWWSEGVTDYYANLTMVRSGLWTEQDFWSEIQREISGLRNNDAWATMSAEEASRSVWEGARPRISYYTKGMLLGLCLDLWIREASGGDHTLDDVMRFLMEFYADEGVGFPAGGLRRAVDGVTGLESQWFFDNYVSGIEPLDYDRFLDAAGMTFEDERKETASAGFSVTGRSLRVTRLRHDTPPHRAGLRFGDEVQSVNGTALESRHDWRDASRKFRPDSEIVLVVEREGERLTFTFPNTLVVRHLPRIVYEGPARTDLFGRDRAENGR